MLHLGVQGAEIGYFIRTYELPETQYVFEIGIVLQWITYKQ